MNWITIPQAPVVAGEAGHLNDHNDIAGALSTLWGSALQGVINVMAPPYSAAGNGTTDDTAAITAALTAAAAQGGGIVFLPWGQYLVSAPIVIPPLVTLVGQTSMTLNLSTPPSATARIVASAAWAPASAAGVVEVLSKTPGGWSVNTVSCGMRDVFIDCSQNTNTNLSGIYMLGPVYDTHLQDVFIYAAPHNGVTSGSQTESGINPTTPYHTRFTRVSAVKCGNYGFGLGSHTDSTFVDCLAFANTQDGWNLQNNSNCIFVGCRAEWNSYGFTLTSSAGSVTFTGCTTDQNTREGLYIHAATGQTTQGGGIVWTGGKLHADANGAVSGHTNGILITGSTVPVAINGVNIESGQDVNNSNYYPANALQIASSSNVTVGDSVLQGISAAYVNGGSNTNVVMEGCIGATGNPGSQTFSILPDITGGSNTAQSAPVLTPSFVSGTAAQLSDTSRDYMVYLQCSTAGTALTVAIGPTSTPANTIINSSTATLGELISIRLPAGWYLKWSATSAAFAQQKAIGC